MREFYPSDCEMDHLNPVATCTADDILPPDQRAQWAEKGILRIPGVFKPPQVAALKASVATATGPLLVLPGSHRRGKLSAAARRELTAAQDARLCAAAAGDVLAMHPLLLHRSVPAEAPSHRQVIHLEYAAAALPAGLAWRYDPLAETGGRATRDAKPYE